jgi:hypothetical protein
MRFEDRQHPKSLFSSPPDYRADSDASPQGARIVHRMWQEWKHPIVLVERVGLSKHKATL